ncbi:MAG: lysine/arginine/ornithine ABC transporter substrate-binding protein [Arenicella sp.]
MFKRTFYLLAVLLITMVSTGVGAAEKLIIGTEGAYPPFNSVGPDGKLVGFDIDIGEALCEAMEMECEWVTSDWDGIIPALLAKKFDVILASMSITEERKQKIDFTGKYYTSPVKFARIKGSDIEITRDGVEGKTIAVQSGTVTENFIRGVFNNARVKAYKTQEEANLDFVAGRVDLLAADIFVLYEFLASEAGEKSEAVGPNFDDQVYLGDGIGIGVRKENAQLRDKLSAAITKIREDGTYKKINDKYFKFDVYGANTVAHWINCD